MSKDTDITHEGKNLNPKYFHPDEDLVNWFKERLKLIQKKKEFQLKKDAGEKLPNSFYKKMKASGARKTEILDKIVFPSMANLIYFFEAITISPSLQNLFEKDIKNLLDPRFTKDFAKSSGSSLVTASHQFRKNSMARLISNALSLKTEKKEKMFKSFKIALLFQLQSIIRDNVEMLLQEEYTSESQITKSASEDFDNTIGWLAFLARSLSDDIDKEGERQIGLPIQLSGEKSKLTLKLS